MTDAQHVWEHPYYPQFYVPEKDFAKKALTKCETLLNGAAWLGKVQVGERSTDKVLGFEKGPLKGLVKVQFDQLGRSMFPLH